MTITKERLEVTLNRGDVIRFLNEREEGDNSGCCCSRGSGRLSVIEDGHAVRLLYAAASDPEGVRGGNLDLYSRFAQHGLKVREGGKSRGRIVCFGDRQFQRMLKEGRGFDPGFREFWQMVRNGRIEKNKTGRWSFVV